MAQVVLLTGASRGLGRTTALHFAAAGARLALLARDAAGLEETLTAVRSSGGDGAAFSVDVTDAAAVARALDQASGELGPVSVLVNNAALGGPIGPLWEVDPGDWWRTIEVNLGGIYVCTNAVLPGMLERGAGRIINIVSNAGAHRWPYMSAYATSKAAVIKLTENLATEIKDSGVSVFAVNPGFVRAGLTDLALKGPAPPEGSIEAGMKRWFERLVADGRTVSAEESAELILQIARGGADELSGRYISVEDDLHALIARANEVERENLHALKVQRLDS